MAAPVTETRPLVLTMDTIDPENLPPVAEFTGADGFCDFIESAGFAGFYSALKGLET